MRTRMLLTVDSYYSSPTDLIWHGPLSTSVFDWSILSAASNLAYLGDARVFPICYSVHVPDSHSERIIMVGVSCILCVRK